MTVGSDVGHGQIWWADLDDEVRPVMVLTRAWVAPRLARVLTTPITTTVREIPCEVRLGRAEGLARRSVANLDNVQLIESDRLLEPIGTVDPARWPEVCAAMAHVIAC